MRHSMVSQSVLLRGVNDDVDLRSKRGCAHSGGAREAILPSPRELDTGTAHCGRRLLMVRHDARA